jgi:hypothetical protein
VIGARHPRRGERGGGGARAPFLATALFDAYGSSTAFGAYITVMAAVSVAGLRDTLPRKVNGV